jgi:activator of HSP90 ATPase
MATQFTVSATIPAAPIEVYDAWLSSKGHTQMTEAGASGKNLKLKFGRQIVQAWRTTEFAAADPDSQIEVLLEKAPRGTKLTLHHTNIPGGQSDYRSGWRECYFEPMKKYFKAKAKSA